jgi:hypothetical protein
MKIEYQTIVSRLGDKKVDLKKVRKCINALGGKLLAYKSTSLKNINTNERIAGEDNLMITVKFDRWSQTALFEHRIERGEYACHRVYGRHRLTLPDLSRNEAA